jgi:hypothetical protein
MTENVTILSLEDRDRWVAEHKRDGLPSQSWHYAHGLSASGVDPKLAIVHSGGARMLLPFYERGWMDSVDIATIVGASGASIIPVSTAPLSLWREFAADRGWVAGYIQLSPFTVLDELRHESDLFINNTNFLLELSARGIFSSVSRTIRAKIRSAEKANVVLVDDRETLARQLKHLYPDTMRRIHAPPHFRFSPETIARWAVDPESLLLGGAVENAIHGVCMFRIVGQYAEAHILGTSENGRTLLAWLIWKGTERLIRCRVRLLNLGGGIRPGDGVYRFKERFHGLPKPRGALRQIYDRLKYDLLCARSGAHAPHEWFPAYREGPSVRR